MDERRRILVVDDEPTIRELIADALSEFGYVVKVASNGAEAFEIIQRWPPHAIVLDLMMPRLNGVKFVELLRAHCELADTPVLLVTAAYSAEEMARRVGAMAWLAKPFELDRLLQLVGELTAPRGEVVDLDTPTLTSSPAEA